jgi:O-antigen ligase
MHVDISKYSRYGPIGEYFLGLLLALSVGTFVVLRLGPWYLRAMVFIFFGLAIFAKRPLGVFLAIFVASIIPGAVVPWDMTNNILANIAFNYYEMAFVVLVVFWFLYRGMRSELRENASVIRGMAVFFLTNLMSLAVCYDYTLTLSQSIFFFCSSLAVFMLTLSLVRKSEDFILTVKVLTGCMVGVSLVSLLELFVWEKPVVSFLNPYTTYQDMIVAWDFTRHSYYRAGSTLGNPNISGAFAVLLLPLFIVLSNRNDIKLRYWYVVSIVALIVQSFLSYSRAAWADTAIILLLWWSRLFTVKTVLKRILIVCAVLFVLFNIYTALVPEFKKIFESRFHPRIVNTIDITHRMGSYLVALNVLQQSPALGIGFYNYKNLYRSLSLVGMENIKTPDNMFLRILIDNGIFGIVAYLVMLSLAFAKIRERARRIDQPDIYYVGWVTFLVFVIESFSFDVMFSLPLRFMFWVLVGLLLSDGGREYFAATPAHSEGKGLSDAA